MEIVKVTSKSFDEVVQNNPIVFIDFWAPWCGPCQSFKKSIQQVAADYPNVVFAEVNIEEEAELAAEFKIVTVPAIMIIRHKVVVYADSGALPATEIRHLLDQANALDEDTLLDGGK